MKYDVFLKRCSATELYKQNLEKGHRAVDRCDHILQIVRQQQTKIDTLQSLAELALKMGDRDLALQLLREKGRCRVEIGLMRPSLLVALGSLQAVIGFLEYESTIQSIPRIIIEYERGSLGVLRISDNLTATNDRATPQVIRFTFRRHKSNKKAFALRKYRSSKSPFSPIKAARQLVEQRAKNLARGMEAIAQTATLLQMAQDQKKKVATLNAKAQTALDRGDRKLALQLLLEQSNYKEALIMTCDNLLQALATLDAVTVVLETRTPVVALSKRESRSSFSVFLLRSENKENRLLLYG